METRWKEWTASGRHRHPSLPCASIVEKLSSVLYRSTCACPIILWQSLSVSAQWFARIVRPPYPFSLEHLPTQGFAVGLPKIGQQHYNKGKC